MSGHPLSPERRVARYDPIGHNPRGEQRGGGRREEPDEDLDGFIKISSHEEPRQYAGKIAWNARNNTHMPLLATGPPAINVAIKAIAVARQFLEQDGLDLMTQPAFRDKRMGASLALYLSSVPVSDLEESMQADVAQLTVSRNSVPTSTAGAIAARAREGMNVTVTGIGPDAVSNSCVAACHARLYLEEDNLDIRAIPLFEEVEKDSKDGTTHTMTALKLKILVEHVTS